MKINKILFFIFVLAFLLTANFVSAENRLNLYFFWGEGCPDCVKEEIYLNEVKNKYSNIDIYDFELYENRDSSSFLEEVAESLGTRVNGAPFTIIGDEHFVGLLLIFKPGLLMFG